MEKEEISPIEEFNQNLKEYLATRYELTVLKTSQKVSIIAALATVGGILALLASLFILFVSFSAGFYLSSLVGSYALGFLILSGVFMLLGVIVFVVRKKWIIVPMKDYLIKEMFNED